MHIQYFFIPLQLDMIQNKVNNGIFLCLFTLWTIAIQADKHDIHILAVNDIHATIEAMPQLIGIVDSLRTQYPSLLLFSAGDNRTGDPINDKYQPSGYPMVALMNLAGFNASAIGNHDFDNYSLPTLCGLSSFRYICANMEADDTTGIKTVPYQCFDVEGLKLGVIGVIQVNRQGTPDAHPDVLRGIRFQSPIETVSRYEWLSRQCDATVLLSHTGYQEDIRIAEKAPWLDAIIGGHSHRQLSEEEPLHNGVLITQNRHLLGHAVHITLTVDSGHVISKQAEYILVRRNTPPNKVAETMVKTFTEDPYFKHILVRAETPFKTREELGAMVCDALMSETGADVAIMNYKGIRIRRLAAGYITVRDALEIDPYGSQAVTLTMRGDELEQFIITYGQMNTYKFPHLGGLRADLTLEKKGSNDITKVKLMAADGSQFDRKRSYRVVTNSYVAATYKGTLSLKPTVLNTTTSDIIMRYLQQQGTVSYQGKSRLNYLLPEK